jgi:hypothetical protein
VLVGVLTGSLLTTVEPLITTPKPAQAAVTVNGCEVDVQLDGGTQVANDTDYVTVSKDGDDCVVQFTKHSTEMVWTLPSHVDEFEALVVAGGGGGALGGGGAGGYYDTYGAASNGSGDSGSLAVPTGSTTAKIFVGQGGNGGTAQDRGKNGADSALVFESDTGYSDLLDVETRFNQEEANGDISPLPIVSATRIVMAGGGGGGTDFDSASDGGSGGAARSGSGDALDSNRGNDGGNGGVFSGYFGGGGGGAGQAGGNAVAAEHPSGKGGDGGNGKQSAITGSAIYRAGGGAGARSSGSGSASSPGEGGGGDSEQTNGTENGDDLKGAGGGGASTATVDAGDGGSGIVIVRFAPPPVDPAPVLGSVTRTDGGFRVPVSNVGDYSGSVSVSASAVTDSGASGSFPVAVSSLSGGVVTVSGLADGESAVLTVTASASGFSPVSVSVTGVAKASQASLSVTGSDDLRFGGSITVAATGGSGSGGVTFGLTSASVTTGCELSGSVLLTGSADATDSCVVTATRAGDANFIASTQATKTFAIGKADRFVSFTSSVPADPVAGDTYTPTATATGGLPVTFSATGECSLTSGVVTFSSVGTCTITAASSGTNTNYEAATAVTQVIEVGLANQTITFDAVGDKDFDDRPFQLSATSSRGLPVSFATSSDACSVTPGGVVSVDGTGLCEVTASQSGVGGQIASKPSSRVLPG